jgi:hypothetical protein
MIPDHCRCVIDRKQRISADLFQLPLASSRRASAFVLLMLCPGKSLTEHRRVVRVRIRAKLSLRIDYWFEGSQQTSERRDPVVGPGAVFSARDLGQWALSRHHTDVNSQDQSRARIHSEWDAERLTLRVFKAHHFVKMDGLTLKAARSKIGP